MSFDLFDTSSAFLHFSDFENAVLPYALGLVYGAIALWVRAEAQSREYVKPVMVAEDEMGDGVDLGAVVAEFEVSEEVLAETSWTAEEQESIAREIQADFEAMMTRESRRQSEEFNRIYPKDALKLPKQKSRKVGALIKDLWEESDESDRLAAEYESVVDEPINFKNFEGINAKWLDYGSFPSE